MMMMMMMMESHDEIIGLVYVDFL